MIRRSEEKQSVRKPAPFNGVGEITVRSLLNGPEEMSQKGRVFGHTTVYPGSAIGYHIHTGDSETYYILSGKGKYNDNGTFVEIAPNLAGLAESCTGLAPGQAVSVYIKNILPEKMKIKLVIVNHALSQPHRFELRYFVTEGHLDRWVYSTPECPKRIETDFAVAACNPG